MAGLCSPGFALDLTLAWTRRVDSSGAIAAAIAGAGGDVAGIEPADETPARVERRYRVRARSLAHQREIVDALEKIEGVTVVKVVDVTHEQHIGGKIFTGIKHPPRDAADLAVAYTPGVARVCRTIAADPEQAFAYTQRRNAVAVLSDGSAILGLGDLGPAAAMPVMEGKALLFKQFGDVDAYPVCVNAKTVDELVAVGVAIAPSYGGINLEDISAPRCFEVEERLQELVDIPVFHDDQHGTAIVSLAALTNAVKVVGKKMEDLRMVVCGVGAAGTACTKLFLAAGVKNIVGVDRAGAIHVGREKGMNPAKEKYAAMTNPEGRRGTLSEVMRGADVFVGLSGPGTVTVEDVKAMAPKAIVFAMSNPDPEIAPELAGPHVAVMATGRSDYPNQINNVLAFPGVFRGALDSRARRITPGMCLAASKAIAARVSAAELSAECIVPPAMDKAVAEAVAAAVAEAARAEGVARGMVTPAPKA